MALETPFGQKPSSLNEPVPPEEQEENIFAALDQIAENPPELDAPAQAPALVQEEPAADDGDIFAALDAINPDFEVEEQPSVAGVAIPSEFGIDAIGENIKDNLLRFQASFAMTDKEKAQFLESKFGQGNVKFENDSFFIKKPGKDKFVEFDPPTLELIGDLMDFGRELTEEAMKVPLEAKLTAEGAAAGAATAGAVSGPAAPLTMPAGALAGGFGGFMGARALGGAMATNAADLIAQGFGIERDPARDRLLETAIASSVDAVFPTVGNKVNKLIGNLKSKNALIASAPIDRLAKMEEDFLVDEKFLRESGIIGEIPGTDSTFLAYQAMPYNQKVRAKATLANTKEKIDELEVLQARGLVESRDTLLRAMGDIGQGKTGLPRAEGVLQENFAEIVKGVRQAEGKLVGEFKTKALKAIGPKTQIPLNRKVADPMLVMLQELKLLKITDKGDFIWTSLPKTKSGAIQMPKEVLDAIEGNMDFKTTGSARNFIREFKPVVDLMKKPGGPTLEEYIKIVEGFDKNFKHATKNPKFLGTYASASRSMRDMRDDIIVSNLPENEAEAYMRQNARFKTVANAQGALQKALQNPMATEAYVKQLFTSGQKGLSNIRATKALLQNRPDIWRKLVGAWLDNRIANSSSAGAKTGFNAGKFFQEMHTSFGRDNLNELMEGTGTNPDQLFALLRFMDQTTRTQFKGAPEDYSREVTKGLSQHIAGLEMGQMNLLMASIKALTPKGKAYLDTVNRAGIDATLRDVPLGKRDRMRKVLEKMLAFARFNGIIDPGPNVERAFIRQQLQQQGNEVNQQLPDLNSL